MTFGTANNGVDTGDKFIFVEGLCEIIVRAESQALDLVVDASKARKDQDRSRDLPHAQKAQHVKSRHIGQVQIEEDNIVVVDLAEVDAFLAEIGRIDVE